MSHRDIIVIGASAGGVEALTALVRLLPSDLPAALFIVSHLPPYGRTVLPEILQRVGQLPAALAVDGEPIRASKIYVAPPDHHLLLETERVRVTHGPKENRFRPAIDPLFRSAAYVYGPGVIGVVLSGALDDGTAGLWAVKDRGGLALVQDPEEALVSAMPESALAYVQIDYCVPVAALGPLLVRLSAEPLVPETVPPTSPSLAIESHITADERAAEGEVMQLGELSPFTCPECHGTLTRLQEGGLLRFRCHTGHAYMAQSLLTELAESLEATLWNTLRVIEEQILLLRHMAQHAQSSGMQVSPLVEQQVQALLQQATQIRTLTVLQQQINPEYVSRGSREGPGKGVSQ